MDDALQLLFTSPDLISRKGGKDWGKVAAMGPAGTGPFKITKVVQRQSVTLAKNTGYWDPKRMPKVDQIILHADPRGQYETGGAALGPGRLDRSAAAGRRFPSLKQAGFVISTRFLPACLAVDLQHGRQGQPVERR